MSEILEEIGAKLITKERDYLYLKAGADYKKGELVLIEGHSFENRSLKSLDEAGLAALAIKDINKDEEGWFIVRGSLKK